MRMTPQEAIVFAQRTVAALGGDPAAEKTMGFLEFAEYAADFVAKAVRRGSLPNSDVLHDWAYVWAQLYEEFRDRWSRDPGGLYLPMHHVALAFHKSLAYVRYYCGGNRTAKTQTAYMEHYLWGTGQHRWQNIPPPPHTTFVIAGSTYAVYAEKVFEKKFVTGEPGNPISPLYPVGGKWLHRYDKQKRIVYLACPTCADYDQAEFCTHMKSSHTLFSIEIGVEVMESFKASLGHIDEHAPESFFQAAQERTADYDYSRHMVTGTPLFGPQAWEQTRLKKVADGPPEENKADPTDPDSPPYVDFFHITQWDAGIVPHAKIRQKIQGMDEFEKAARVEGLAATLARHPVFDRFRLAEMMKTVKTPAYGELVIVGTESDEDGQLPPAPIHEVALSEEIEFIPILVQKSKQTDWTGWRVWEAPKRGATYVLTADIAKGVQAGNYSAASVARVWYDHTERRRRGKIVAQFYGHIDTDDYADELKKAGVWYNDALIAPETTGLGQGVVLRLRKKLFYWNLFRDEARPQLTSTTIDHRLGIETNTQTKPAMVGAAVTAIKKGTLEIPCADTLTEMTSFEQETSDSKKTTIYRGVGGVPDDRTMSIVMLCWIAFNWQGLAHIEEPPPEEVPEYLQEPSGSPFMEM